MKRLTFTLLIVTSAFALLVGCGSEPDEVTNNVRPPAAAVSRAPIVPDAVGNAKVFIGFKKQPGAAEEALVRGHRGKVKYTYHLIPAIAATVPEAAIPVLQANPNVTHVDADGRVWALDSELDNSWGVKRIGAGVVHGYNKGTGVKIAVIDTGIDYNHSDLDANYAGGYDFVNTDTDPMDDHGHGTHVAGIIAAEDNDDGVVGVAPEAALYALKVLDETGGGYWSDLIAAIQWSVDNGIQVINMSLGGTGTSDVEAACQAASDAGLLLVAAAGNSGNPPGKGDNISDPAGYASVIAVAATNKDDERARWSSTGPDLELSAPGVDINSTLLGGGYGEKMGTSMASPHVAGTAALVWIAYPSWTNADVRTQLQNTADDLGVAGWDSKYGYGLVDADQAAPDTTPPEPTHDVAVTSINVPSTVGQGDIVAVDVSVANEGTYDETFTLTLTDSDEVTIGLETVSLAAGESTTITFDWDTTASSLGDHLLKAEASVVEGETDTADNVKTVTVRVIEKKALYVDVTTDKGTYTLGETVHITVTARENDATGPAIEGAAVHCEITTASGRKYAGDGTTDANGQVVFSLKTKKPDGKGTYSVTADATKSGYEPGSGSTTFEVQ